MKKAIIIVVFLISLAGIGVTFALENSKQDIDIETATNNIKTAKVSLTTIENGKEVNESGQEIVWYELQTTTGEKVLRAEKKVKIKNTGTVDTYLRVQFFPTWKLKMNGEEEEIYAPENTKAETTEEDGTVIIQEDLNSFKYGDVIFYLDKNWHGNGFFYDGYFYYRKPLSPGEETPMILSHVMNTVPNMKNNHPGSTLYVEVLTEGIQVEGTYETGTESIPAVETMWPVKQNEDKTLSPKD